jgi:hypothetical protein
VLTSGDGGDRFVASTAGLLALGVSALGVDPRSGTWLAGLTTGAWLGPAGAGLRRSTNGGRTWRPSAEGLGRRGGGPLLNAIAHHPRRRGVVLAGGSSGLLRSLDGGASWQPVDLGGNVADVLVDDDGAAWAVGTQWVPCGIPFCGTIPVPVALRSRDAGASWQFVLAGIDPGGQPWERSGSLAAVAHDPVARRWYAGGSGGIFVRESTDGAWRSLAPPSPSAVVDLLVPPATAKARGRGTPPLPLYAAVGAREGNRVLISRDGGESFTVVSEGLSDDTFVRRLAAHPRIPGTLFAATSRGVFVSHDEGSHWQRLGPRLAGHDVISLAVAPGPRRRSPITLLAGTTRGPGLFVITLP